MADRVTAVCCIVLVLALSCCSWGRDVNQPPPTSPDISPATLELARYLKEFSSARLEPARMGAAAGIAVVFEGTADLHYYAKPETAPAPGFELKVKGKSDLFNIGQAVFPKWHVFTDSLGEKIEVFSGNFVVFLPVALPENSSTGAGSVEVAISGIACTSIACLSPFEKTLHTTIDLNQSESWKQIALEPRADERPAAAVQDYSIWFALTLAFLAGLILNIMPCVLPVIPLKVLSIFEQAKESKARCVALGLSFCLGILLFFAGIAVLNIVLRLGYGAVFQWGDHFRNPLFLIAMSLLLVVLALFMFGVFTVTVPSSISGRAAPRKGHAGSIAMGLLAAVLSTPCSFAILTTAFAWAQTQRLPTSTLAIMMIGVGMAAPYAILTSIPALLKHLPRPGRWMELFKQSMGFVLLIVAVWLLTALPANRQPGVMYFAAILAFCVWMWGGWVTLTTPGPRRRTVRTVALIIAVAAAAWLLPEPKSYIDWRQYDRTLIDQAVKGQKPVLIEFMADWCITCKAVEKTVYHRKDIAELIKQKGVLPIKADTTLDDSPATIDLKDRYKEPGVPVTILFVPGQTEPKRFHGLIIGGDLKKALQNLTSPFPSPPEQNHRTG